MANTRISTTTGGQGWRLDTTGVVALGDAHRETVSTWAVQFVVSGAGGDIFPQQRLIGSELTSTDYQSCVWYESDQETAITAGTAKSTAGIYYIPSDGCETFLNFTSAGSGYVDVWAWPVQG